MISYHERTQNKPKREWTDAPVPETEGRRGEGILRGGTRCGNALGSELKNQSCSLSVQSKGTILQNESEI